MGVENYMAKKRPTNATLVEARSEAAWKLRKNYRHADYYFSKYHETIGQTEEKARAGDDNALLQLIEWDKSYLSERFISARIAIAESHYLAVDFRNNIREEGKRFLQRLSSTVKKVGQLPKIKKYWNLITWMRNNAHDMSIDDLTDLARKHRGDFPEQSSEEDFLANKRAIVRRFILTHKHFINVS